MSSKIDFHASVFDPFLNFVSAMKTAIGDGKSDYSNEAGTRFKLKKAPWESESDKFFSTIMDDPTLVDHFQHSIIKFYLDNKAHFDEIKFDEDENIVFDCKWLEPRKNRYSKKGFTALTINVKTNEMDSQNEPKIISLPIGEIYESALRLTDNNFKTEAENVECDILFMRHLFRMIRASIINFPSEDDEFLKNFDKDDQNNILNRCGTYFTKIAQCRQEREAVTVVVENNPINQVTDMIKKFGIDPNDTNSVRGLFNKENLTNLVKNKDVQSSFKDIMSGKEVQFDKVIPSVLSGILPSKTEEQKQQDSVDADEQE